MAKTVFNTDSDFLGLITATQVANATGDVVTIDAFNVLKRRTYAEILTDVGAAPLVHTHVAADITDSATAFVDFVSNQYAIGGEKTFTGAVQLFDGRVGVQTPVFGGSRLGDAGFQTPAIDTQSINFKDVGQLTAVAMFATAVGGSDGYVFTSKNFVDDVMVYNISGIGNADYTDGAREVETTFGLRNDYTAGQFSVFDTFNNDYPTGTAPEVRTSQGWVAIHGGGATAKEIGLWRYDTTTYTPIWELSPTNDWTFGTGVNVIFTEDAVVPDEVYGVGWDASLEVPTKNAVYDKIESLNIPDISGLTLGEFISVDGAGDLVSLPEFFFNGTTLVIAGAAVNSNSTGTFTDVLVNDEIYGVAWNGSLEVPTKNALYDKIETLGGAATWGGITGTLSAQTDLQTALDEKVNLAGDTMTGGLEIREGNLELFSAANNSTLRDLRFRVGANDDQGVSIRHEISDGLLLQTGYGILIESNGAIPQGNAHLEVEGNVYSNGTRLLNTAGDTMTGALTINSGTSQPLILQGTGLIGDNTAQCFLQGKDSAGSNLWYIGDGSAGSSDTIIYNYNSDQFLRLAGTGGSSGFTFYDGIGTSTVWHSRNDGAGSGLDADLLDGLQRQEYTLARSSPHTDFNSFTTASELTSINTATNAPYTSAWYTLYNARHRGGASDGNVWGSQIAIGMTNFQDTVNFRTQSSGTWSSWTEILHGGSRTQTKTGELRVRNLVTQNTGVNAPILTFNTERPWFFRQGNSGASTTLDLIESTGSKQFNIGNGTTADLISFFSSSGAITTKGTITSNGDILCSKTTARITASQGASQFTRIEGNGSGGAIVMGNVSGTDTVIRAYSNSDFGNTLTAPNFILTSDRNLKENFFAYNVEPIEIELKWFEWKQDKGQGRTQLGVIAQELEVKHPEFVITNDEGVKSVAYIDLLLAKNAELENRIERLENKLDKLIASIA